MKHKKSTRIIALLLVGAFLLGGGVVAVSADDEASEPVVIIDDDNPLEEIKKLSTTDNYSEYTGKNELIKRAESPIVIDAVNYAADKTTSAVYRVKVNENTGIATVVSDDYEAKTGETIGLFSPASGSISFEVDVPETAKYELIVRYFPASEVIGEDGKTITTDKSGSIERILKIDGEVPFTEARYLTLTKVWKNTYTVKFNENSERTGKDANYYAEIAKDCGIGYTINDGGASITFVIPESGWTAEMLEKIQKSDLRFFTEDIDGNEIRPSMKRVPEWCEYACKDVDGFLTRNFEFVFEEGRRVITLEAKSQTMVISQIILMPQENRPSYDEVKAGYEAKGYKQGESAIKIEAEFAFATSSQTIYPIEDSSSAATSPSDTSRTVLNTIGGEKWQTSGQKVRYKFKVDSDGLYQIVARYRQNVNDGMFSSRVLYLYSDGLREGQDGYYNGIPFLEASNLRFDYSTDWQAAPLSYFKEKIDENGKSTWDQVELEFYFKAGVTYTMEFEVALGDMGSIVDSVNKSLTNINSYYLSILKLTGADPDEYRDYGFYRILPDTMQGLVVESRRLTDIAAELSNIAGAKSSNVATLERIAWLLNEMGTDENNVAKYLEELKTYIGSLGTWINDNKTQPLQLDYFVIQNADAPLPVARANFFQSFWHEISKFIQSFIRNYNRMGATSKDFSSEKSVEVWLAKGRDQTQVIRNLINNDFTPESGILVNLKLVTASTLLPSILAGSGPDVYIGISEDNIINYAIRGALINIENFDGFYDITSQYVMEHEVVEDLINTFKAENYIVTKNGSETLIKSGDGVTMYTITYESDGSGKCVDRNGKFYKGFTKEGWLYETGDNFSGVTYLYKKTLGADGQPIVNDKVQFNEAAMYVLGLPDSDDIMHYYGLPEEQGFAMMFVRNDILASLGLDIPKSWDDVQAAIPVLQSNNMMIGMSNDYKKFLYQKGSQLFADDGMRINLDSNVALDSFDFMCNLFTMYSFPYKYDFSNRFRTGEMPIGIAGYNGTYNQLIVFATEIRGLWSFYPVPGIATYEKDAAGDYVYDENGNKVVKNINNVAIATVSAISMINGCENQNEAWEFMKWHVGADCQVNYSNEMVAILGDSAKYATANITALESMPWTTAEYAQLKSQFDNLASIPNYPGSYIIGRYTKFAFLAAYDDKANPAEALREYINTINKEITRKRAEFELETLEVGQSLAGKRIDEALAIVNGLPDDIKAKYKAAIAEMNAAIEGLSSTMSYNSDEQIDKLSDAAWTLRLTQYSEFYGVAEKLETAAEALRSYQASYRTED